MYSPLSPQMGDRLLVWFDVLWNNSDKLMLIPILLTVVAGAFLLNNYVENGEIITTGVDFRGGTEILVDLAHADRAVVFSRLSADFEDVQQRLIGLGSVQQTAFEVPGRITEAELLAYLNGTAYKSFEIQSVGSSVSSAFFREAQYAILAAFILMSAVIFVAFRNIIPSLAVILAAVMDLVVTGAAMQFFGIKLTLATLAALLMLLGFSVDTDVLVSSRVLHNRPDQAKEMTLSAMKTGLTYSITSLAAFSVLFLVSNSPVLDGVALVMVIGLVVDIISTWLMNAAILKRYVGGSHG